MIIMLKGQCDILLTKVMSSRQKLGTVLVKQDKNQSVTARFKSTVNYFFIKINVVKVVLLIH